MAAKLNIDPIVKDDILEFLDHNSDFAFELKTLKLLNSLEFDCQHCGSYVDDNTKKIREFDIRASKLIHPRTLRLAVCSGTVKLATNLEVIYDITSDKKVRHEQTHKAHIQC